MFRSARSSKIQVDIDKDDSYKVHKCIEKALKECKIILNQGGGVMDKGKECLKK